MQAVVTPFPAQPNRFMRIKDVCALTALSPSYVYELQAKEHFPRSRKISGKVAVWLESEVREWMRAQWEQAA